MSQFWIATDFHFGHKKMLEVGRQPGYEQKILKALSFIPDTDTLIFLGDFCIGDDARWHYELNQFWFRKWLIKGNHDRKSMTWYLEHGWDVVCESIILDLYGKSIILSHYPYQAMFGEINIHGHFHDLSEEKRRNYYDEHFDDNCNCVLATEYPQTLRSMLK